MTFSLSLRGQRSGVLFGGNFCHGFASAASNASSSPVAVHTEHAGVPRPLIALTGVPSTPETHPEGGYCRPAGSDCRHFENSSEARGNRYDFARPRPWRLNPDVQLTSLHVHISPSEVQQLTATTARLKGRDDESIQPHTAPRVRARAAARSPASQSGLRRRVRCASFARFKADPSDMGDRTRYPLRAAHRNEALST